MASLWNIVSTSELYKYIHRCWEENDVYLILTTCDQRFREHWRKQRLMVIRCYQERRELYERLRQDQLFYPLPLRRPPATSWDLACRARWLQAQGGYAPGGSPWRNILGTPLDTPEVFCLLHNFWKEGMIYIAVTTLTRRFRDKGRDQRELVIQLYQEEIAYQCYLERMWWWPSMFGDGRCLDDSD